MPLEMFPELTPQRRLEVTEQMYKTIAHAIELHKFDPYENVQDFLNTIKTHIEKGWILSDKQLKWLKDIYEDL